MIDRVGSPCPLYSDYGVVPLQNHLIGGSNYMIAVTVDAKLDLFFVLVEVEVEACGISEMCMYLWLKNR